VLVLSTGLLVVLGIVFAEPIVTAFAGSFAAVPGKLELTIELAELMLPFLTLVAIAAVLMGMLNALNHYFVPALAPAAFNVATIVCAIALVPVMTTAGMPDVMALAVAVLLGGLGQIAIQWAPLRHEGFRYEPRLDWRDPALRRVLLLMGPGTLGLAATQLNLVVTTQIATGEGTGAVSWLTYAFRLMYLPIGLFGVSIATAVLPQIARHAALADRRSVRETLSHGLSLMLIVNLPAMAGLLVLATPIIRLLLEHGRFTPSDTAATASALRYYAIGLVGYSAVRIVSPIFYALGSHRVPLFVSTASVALNTILSLLLVDGLGFGGLALSTSLAATVNAGVLLVLLRKHLDRIDGRLLAKTFGRATIAASVMALVVAGVHSGMEAVLEGHSHSAQAASLTLAISAGLVSLVVSAKVLQLDQVDDVLSRLRRRVLKLLTSR
jgi:putative peptidoglycan lipid II flippase